MRLGKGMDSRGRSLGRTLALPRNSAETSSKSGSALSGSSILGGTGTLSPPLQSHAGDDSGEASHTVPVSPRCGHASCPLLRETFYRSPGPEQQEMWSPGGPEALAPAGICEGLFLE